MNPNPSLTQGIDFLVHKRLHGGIWKPIRSSSFEKVHLCRRRGRPARGHIVVGVIHLGPEGAVATMTAAAGKGGMSIRNNMHVMEGTCADYRCRLEIVLAGSTAEEVMLGSASHGMGGAAGSDLDRATTLACAMVGSLGLTGPGALTYFGAIGSGREFLRYPEIRAAVRELRQAAESCKALLKKHQGALEAVALRLSEAARIDGGDVKALIEAAASKESAS